MTLLLPLALASFVSAQQAPRSSDPWQVVRVGPGSIAVPRDWRILDGLRPRTLVFRQGDGIGIPLLDDTGQPLQAGVVVEEHFSAKKNLREIADEILAGAQADSRLKPLADPRVDALKLTDSTEALFMSSMFLKEGQRRSLQLKLIARSADSRLWLVSAFLVGGKDSRWCTVDSELGRWLGAHVLSLTLTPAALDEGRLREAYRRRRVQ